jgi:type IV/VI secretion system ImpK/VasF family protein
MRSTPSTSASRCTSNRRRGTRARDDAAQPSEPRGADLLLYRACADVLALAAQLPAAPLPPSPAELRQQLVAALDKMVSRGRRAELPDRDLAEARYALVAFLDEQVLRASWQGRTEWMNRPLQFELYQDNNAGEDFFVRLSALLRGGDRPLAVQVYYLCLALGFEGMYAQNGDRQSLAKFVHAARRQLAAVLPATDCSSPHGVPARRTTSRTQGGSSWFWLLGGTLLVALTIATSAWSVERSLRAALSGLSESPAQLSPGRTR